MTGDDGARAGVEIVRGAHDPAAVDRILRALPDWFGIEESIVAYVGRSAAEPTYLARPVAAPADAPAVVGVLVLVRHFPGAAEVHLMAVDPAFRGRGVGRALLRAVEDDLRADGVRLLQVKTLDAPADDPHYGSTVRFYRAAGFEPLEVLPELWGPENPCLVLVKTL